MGSGPTAASRAVRRLSGPVRNRLTLLATSLLAVALAIAAAMMLQVLHQVLLRSADAATGARAAQIAAVLREEGLADLDPPLLTPSGDVDIVQVVSGDGRVLVSNLPGASALTPPVGAGQQRTLDGARTSASPSEFRATVLGTDTPTDGLVTIAVGADEGPINRLVVVVAVLFCVVFPIVLIGLAWSTYYFVGRALRPVEGIRAEVEEISGGDLTRRVPVPATGDEIATLATTMNAMLDRIELARTEQLRFVNDASHELNSPLATLVGMLDLARATREPIDTDTVDTVLLPEALRLTQLVADLLLLARADESGIALRVAAVDLDDIVGSEVARLETVTGHAVHAEIVAVRIIGDREKLTRALRNIVDNAIRYTRGRLDLAMSTDPVADTVTVTVTDDGPGIGDTDKARVFERFVRLDSSRQRGTGGSGLGLAIVAEVVRTHHGHVFVADADGGGGAVVGFTLPVARPRD